MFDSYRHKYENVRMKREEGILEVALHSGDGPLVFNGYVHEALVKAFRDIGDDPENHVVIRNMPTFRMCLIPHSASCRVTACMLCGPKSLAKFGVVISCSADRN